MVAAVLLLVVIADTALTGWLLATVKGIKKVSARNASLIKRICEEDGNGRSDADSDVDD